ncbi:PD-(D/E)XK nuclease family protein [Geodermatophilus sp. SYSU D00742]
MTPIGAADWEARISTLGAEWADVVQSEDARDRAAVAEWTEHVFSLLAEMQALKDDGEWLGGPRTLLHVLKLEQRELVLTAGLAWLLDPEGFHRLGNRVLSRFLALVGVDVAQLTPVEVQLEEWGAQPEEARTRTRADLLLRVPGGTVLVEAKVGAGEQADQCTRLAEDWRGESPVFVFLTPNGRPPTTDDGVTPWQRLSWAAVAGIIADSVADLGPGRAPAPGALDYLHTLQHFHGSDA